MATPKIRIKRGSSAPTSTVIPSSGEMAIDTSNKKFYIQLSDGTTPTWMGSPIDDSTWNNNSNLATQTLIENTFCKKATTISVAGVTSSGTISGTDITGSGTVTGTTLIGKGLKIQDPNDTDYVQLKASSMTGNSYDLTFPSSLSGGGTMKVDTNGNISFATDNTGVTINTATSGTLYYPMLATATGAVSTVYIDNTAGLTAVNGPLTYQPSTGTLTVNGDLVVNGQSAPVTVSLSSYGAVGKAATLLNNDTVLQLSSVVGISAGDEVELVTTTVGTPVKTLGFSGGVTTVTVASVSIPNSTITLNTAVTVSAALNAAESNSVQIRYQSLSAKITSNGTATDKAEIFNTNVLDIAVGAAATTVAIANNNTSSISIGSSLTLNSNAVGNTSTIYTAGNTASFAPTTSTTVNIGNAATTMTLGGNSTASLTYNFGANATANSNTKTINIGTSGASGSTTNIVLGAQNGTNAHTIYGAVTNAAGSSPSADDQLVTRGYVNTAAVGLNTRGSAAAATTGTVAALAGTTVTYGNTTISWTGGNSFAASTGSTIAIDGVNIYYGDAGDPTAATPGTSVVVLVKDEGSTNAARNGLYYVSAARTLTRISTADTANELPKGTYIFVTAGTLNSGKGFITDAAVTTLGTTPINWNQFTQSTTYTGSAPITVAGNSISLNYSSNSFDLNSNQLRLKSTVAGNGLTYSSEVLSVSSSITVKAATTANVDLTTDISQVDGVSLSAGDIYLVKNQTNPALNGIWQRSSSSAAPTRYSLYDSQSEINGTRTIYVSGGGTVNGGKSFTLITPAPSTIATTGTANSTSSGPILYIEANTGTSYTPDNYYTIGAPLVKTSSATEKAYYLNDIYHAASASFSLNAGASITVNIAGWSGGDTRNIPADITPGLKVTKFGSADFTSYSIYIGKIDRTLGTINLINKGTTALTNITIAASAITNTAGSGVTLELENPSSNSYYGTPKGILVYNKKDYSEWSALQFTPNSTSSTDGTWSIINSSAGGNSFNSTNLVGDTLTQTLKNKTLDSTNTIGLNLGNGSVSSTTIISPYIQTVSADVNRYKYPIYTTDGTSNAAEWYSTSPAIFDVATDTYQSTPYQSFAVNGPVHNLRTGTKLFVTAAGLSVNITSGTYYAIVTGPNTLKFASTYSDAISGTAITRSSTSTVNSSNTIKIIASSVDLTLGTGGKGSFGYIRMPTIDSDTISYDYIFGDKDDISTTATQITIASVNQATAQTGDTYAFSNVTTSISGNVYAYDTTRTDQNVPLGQITSITGTQGSNTVTITFQNTQSFTANDWVTIANINNTTHSSIPQADRKLLNYAHKVNAIASGTTVVLKLRNNLSTNINLSSLATNNSFAPIAVKNYEIYFVCKNNPEFKLGSTVVFSNDATSGTNELKIRGVYTDTDVGDGVSITYTIVSLANVGSTTAKGFGIRVPYICYTSDSSTPNTPTATNNYSGQGLNGNSTARNVRSTITAPTETVGYTGRRVLLNTLIDCGSY